MHHESNQPEHEQYRDDGPKQTAHEVLLFARVTARMTPATSHLPGAQRHLRANSRIKIVSRRSSTRNYLSHPTTNGVFGPPEPQSASPTSERGGRVGCRRRPAQCRSGAAAGVELERRCTVIIFCVLA